MTIEMPRGIESIDCREQEPPGVRGLVGVPARHRTAVITVNN
jgi:hypothetical protein